MIDIIICFSHRNVSFFLVIIGIYLRHPPYFNLVFTLIFTYTSMGTLMEISTLSYLPTYLPTYLPSTDRQTDRQTPFGDNNLVLFHFY